MSSKPVVTAAVVQAGSILFDTARTLDKLADLASDASARGADLAVFPEAFVGGYPKGLDFGATVGSRTPAGRDDFLRYHASAIDVPGPATEAIATVARASKLHLVVGVIERSGGTLYCSALTFGPDGALLAHRRKLMPTASERLVWGFGDGSTLDVARTPLGRIGTAICWENYMPLLRTALYAKGVEIYCAPTVDDRATWLPTMQTIALEGRCFVLSASQYLLRKDCPAEYDAVQGSDPGTVLIRGGSCIVGPLGNVLVEPDFAGESVRLAELDRADIVRGKFDFDVVGHYARPDIFSLGVKERPLDPVTATGPGAREA
ncbi:carbon-nitrogen hydrolase family protein [Methylobacterium mesophilicum SR1.6/6]|uniref:Carbon-nitrogen hydrolase family protein n=1 Tax=Methylobacterium mesophilicum SR1.6/6 TaxID=908290 RepID=A0A6B9FHK5_9HYPH|nr:carbon-nitrogen hydrolase family protein [Methylobacterium mesophilicum]QGY00594.1 carbon-nitrogen hydrolase family protein [Methylobacterium mesophilicum SR1.6/6]